LLLYVLVRSSPPKTKKLLFIAEAAIQLLFDDMDPNC